MDERTDELVPARATIHLPGLPLGETALVDPSTPYIADALAGGYLVRESPAVVRDEEQQDRGVKSDVLDVV